MSAPSSDSLPIEAPQPSPKVMGLVPRSAFLWAAGIFLFILIGLFIADVTGLRGGGGRVEDASAGANAAASAVVGTLGNAPSPRDIESLARPAFNDPSAQPAVIAANLPEPKPGAVVSPNDKSPVPAGRQSSFDPAPSSGPAVGAILPEEANRSAVVAAQAMSERYQSAIQSLDEGNAPTAAGTSSPEARAALQLAQVARGGVPGSNPEQDFANFTRDMAATQMQQQRAMEGLARTSRQSPSQTDRAWIKDYSSEEDSGESKVRQLNLEGLVLQNTRIPVVALEAINSDLPGSVTAISTSDIFDSLSQRRVAIPRGTRFYGSYSSEIRPGQVRLLSAYRRMVLPDGRSVDLMGATGTDSIGRAGIEGDVDNHFLKMFGHSFAIAFIASKVSNKNGLTSSTAANGVTSTGSVAGEVLSQVAQQILQRNASIPPTISLPSGVPFTITLAKDVRLPPLGVSNAR